MHVDQESLQTTGKEIFHLHANLYELGHDNVHCNKNAGFSENSINIKNEYMARTQYTTVSTPSRIDVSSITTLLVYIGIVIVSRNLYLAART